MQIGYAITKYVTFANKEKLIVTTNLTTGFEPWSQGPLQPIS